MSKANNGAEDSALKTGRDIRVDAIGFAEELVKHVAKPGREKVKADALGKQLRAVEGDFFRGEIRGLDGTIKTISARKFLAQVKTESNPTGRITMKQFLDCITVRRGEAEEFFGDRDLDEMSDEVPASPSLTIFRKKGVEPKLLEELRSLAAALQAENPAK